MKGHGPNGPNEIAVESSTLRKAELSVGDQTTAVIGDQTSTVRIVGEVHFGALFGATAVLVDDPTARRLFSPDGTVPAISVSADPGVSQLQLRETISQALPKATEAVTGADILASTESAVQKGLGFFTTFLLAFAGVALFVATAVFGAVLGTLLGVGLGIALQRGLQAQGLNTLGIPWPLILTMLVASVIVGILAAVLPSLRAVRLSILRALAQS